MPPHVWLLLRHSSSCRADDRRPVHLDAVLLKVLVGRVAEQLEVVAEAEQDLGQGRRLHLRPEAVVSREVSNDVSFVRGARWAKDNLVN